MQGGPLSECGESILASRQSDAWAGCMLAEPFSHIVIDGLFPAAVVEALAAEIPERFDCSHAWTTGGQTCFSRGGHEIACTHHIMKKHYGNGACGVRMRRRKRLGLLSNQGAVHQALARFHSEHVGN